MRKPKYETHAKPKKSYKDYLAEAYKKGHLDPKEVAGAYEDFFYYPVYKALTGKYTRNS